MTDLRQAAQQALEALEHADKDDFWREQRDAITALKAALEQQAEPVAWYDGEKFYGSTFAASVGLADMIALRPLYTTPPQQQAEPCQFCGLVQCDPRCMWIQKDIGVEQAEPVAWMYPSDLEKFQQSETFAQAFSIKVGCPDEVSVPLYTAQPQRKPLTDEQVAALLEDCIGSLPVAKQLIRATEAAHGIKEGA